MPRISPFLWFDTQAEDAANLYVGVFPNSRITGISRQGPDGPVMLVSFELDGQPVMALNGGPHFTFSPAISLFVDCRDQAEVDHYWAALTADGGADGECGWLTDRFGLSWQIIPEALMAALSHPDPAAAARATQAMLAMKKIDVAAIEAAVAG